MNVGGGRCEAQQAGAAAAVVSWLDSQTSPRILASLGFEELGHALAVHRGPHAVLPDELVPPAVHVLQEQGPLLSPSGHHGIQVQGQVSHAVKLKEGDAAAFLQLLGEEGRLIGGRRLLIGGLQVLHLDVNVVEALHAVQVKAEVGNVGDTGGCSLLQLVQDGHPLLTCKQEEKLRKKLVE